MLGYTPYELAQSFDTWTALIHPDDRKPAMQRIQASMQKKLARFEVEYRLKTKQGGWRWIMARGKVMERDGDGSPTRMVGTHVDITERKLNEEALREREATLRRENIRLRSTLKSSDQFGRIIGKSTVMRKVYETILKSALSAANVIIDGESGTGKELVAETIHALSERSHKRFVTVNCGAIPDNLIESEFFGFRKGAFTGAAVDKPGFLDMADGGTLFMDEIAELDLNMQAKLLRAIEGGGYTPIGSREIKRPDVRIIAATNRDLTQLVKNGRIREDFYYRIHIVPIHLPPLRNRQGDLPLLIHHFLRAYSQGRNVPSIPEAVMVSMLNYDWPGNVRELQNTIHRYVTLKKIEFGGHPSIESEQLGSTSVQGEDSFTGRISLAEAKERFEKGYILDLLQKCRWHRGRTATALNINRKTLFKKMRQYGIDNTPK
jgi:PAS domain S-box-containing protein